MGKIALFLQPPVFADEEKTRHAQVLHTLLLSTGLAFLIGSSIGIAFVFGEKKVPSLFVLIGLIVLVTALFLNQRGKVRGASLVFISALWLITTLLTIVSQGTRSLDMIFYVSGTLAAGLTLGTRGAIFYAAASAITGLMMAILSSSGLVVFPDLFPFPPFAGWLLLVMNLIFTVIPLNITLDSLSKALTLARTELLKHQQTAIALQSSEERHRLISSLSADYTFFSHLDENGHLQTEWIAGAFEHITGYSIEEFLTQGQWAAILHPDDREKDKEDVKQLLRNQRVVTEIRIIHKNDGIRWVRVYAHPLWNEESQQITGIYGAVQDITEQKQVEEVLERERTLLRTVINNLPDYIYLKDIEHRCLVSNLANAQALGASTPEEVEGKTLFDFYPPEEAERFHALDDKIIATGQDILRQEGTFIDAGTGRRRWTWMTRTLLRAKNGRIIGVVGISRDITDYKEAEMEREKLIGDLQAKNRELERFTYTASHDLKTPLVTVTGFLGYLEKDMLTGNIERMKKDIAQIREAANKMKRLLDDLLELSRIGRVMNPPTELPFNQIVQEAIFLVKGRIAAHHVQVEVAENLPSVYGDRVRLVELVQNLLDNATKFMGDQPNPRIEIGSQGVDEQGNLVFFVRDNGIGIAPSYHENVFGLFNKLNPQAEGTGIGLALVKQIIEVHNGRIWIESSGDGQGSTFCFALPPKPHHNNVSP